MDHPSGFILNKGRISHSQHGKILIVQSLLNECSNIIYLSQWSSNFWYLFTSYSFDLTPFTPIYNLFIIYHCQICLKSSFTNASHWVPNVGTFSGYFLNKILLEVVSISIKVGMVVQTSFTPPPRTPQLTSWEWIHPRLGTTDLWDPWWPSCCCQRAVVILVVSRFMTHQRRL